ncbi:hypothetical protein [Sphaerimonospora thailandensis]|uniref:Uncharacterized protein n=1 Tax=Sphaerimonospora thailandensis TaxID=795644 RepID=A0A8J3VZQ8_9ACTN|nr:hypothetical protein [Sphaerimonospora thailandensis]GIH70308.1 hypothetical protein Mth01_25610 [Sphaerimonospora thailandensis]
MTDPFNLRDTLTASIGAVHAQVAINAVATWARAQAAVFELGDDRKPWEAVHNAATWRHVARMMTAYGAAPPAPDPTELVAKIWGVLADAGHTPATDSPTSDGFLVGHMPGAVLVALARGTGLTGTPWAAVQRQMLDRWAATLTNAGYQPKIVGDTEAPPALYIALTS